MPMICSSVWCFFMFLVGFIPPGTLTQAAPVSGEQVSQRLAISPHTVNTHRKAIMAKLKLHHKGPLMLHALQQG
jgi:hypothetical protein